ncbi:MAG: sugar transferase [Bryobacteraceae bacterium]|jgi:lipopolysaccharide/colanic/teichoic acid biosynthesis glycosyltransferase
MRIYRKAGKRTLDLWGAFVLLLLALPLLVICSAGVMIDMGWPVVFRQRRAGLMGRPFWIFKFRSMTRATGADGRLLPDRARITRFGSFLRETSLDELPGLFNVLAGDMSLVGPRPLPIEHVGLYSGEQAKRLSVKPGVTGLAGVNGRNSQPWEKIFEYDLRYVSEQSFRADMAILVRTALTVLRREGIERGDMDRESPFAEAVAGLNGNDAGAGGPPASERPGEL